MSVNDIIDEYIEITEYKKMPAFHYLIQSYAEEYISLSTPEIKELEDFIKSEFVKNIHDVSLGVDTAKTVLDNDLLKHLSLELLNLNKESVIGLILYGIASYRKGNRNTAFDSIRGALEIKFVYSCRYCETAKLITELNKLLNEHSLKQPIVSILDGIKEENELNESEGVTIELIKQYLSEHMSSEQLIERTKEIERSHEKAGSILSYLDFLDNRDCVEQYSNESKMITSPADIQKYVSKLLKIEIVTTVIDNKTEEEDFMKSLHPYWLRDEVYVEREEQDFEYVYEYDYTFESLLLITLDKHLHPIGHHILQTGGAYSVQVPFKRIIDKAKGDKAKFVIIVHNHPGNIAEPSEADNRVARSEKENLQRHNFVLLDNIIVTADNSYYSYRSNGLL